MPIFIVYFFRFRELFQDSRTFKDTYEKYKGKYYRDIPYDDHFLDLFFFLKSEGFTTYQHLIHALLLKWLDEDKISLVTIGITKWRKKEKKAIRFHPTNEITNEYEQRLFDLFLQLKGPNKAVPLNPTWLWTNKLREAFGEWTEDALEGTKEQFLAKRYLEKVMVEKFNGPVEDYKAIGEGKELQRKIYKFMNYMTDFSLIDEHDADNVKLWQQFMIWSALFGLTDEVIKQFENISPNVLASTLYDKDTINSLNDFTSSTIYANYTSVGGRGGGGGGSISVGGGGGSFGGGSGGGTR